MKRVLVAGATGYLGRYVVKTLKSQGFYTKILVRDPDKLDQRGDFLAPSIDQYVDEVAVGDVTKPDTLKYICENIDYVFSSVGMTRQKSKLTFKDVDFQGNLNLLKEAEDSRVEKFMYIHVFINENWKENGSLIEAKEQFVSELKASNIHHIIIQPTGYFSDMTQFLMMAKKGRVFLIGDGKTKMNPVHGSDLAQFCIQSLSMKDATLDIGGPEILSYEQIAQLVFDVLDRKERITHIPVALLKPVSVALKLFSKHHFGLYQFLINVMTHDIIAPQYGKYKIRDWYDRLEN